jgi:TrmH family RNA methyltransferase
MDSFELAPRITSARNPRFMEYMALRKRTDRAVRGAFLLDGEKLAREALNASSVRTLLIDEGRADIFQPMIREADASGVEVLYLAAGLLARLSDTPSPQGIIAVASLPEAVESDQLGSRALILDGVQDPGNVGTIIRTADAAGVTGILMSGTCADPYSMKAVRASMGSAFRVPVCVRDSLAPCVSEWRGSGTRIIKADMQGVPYAKASKAEPWALIIGSEGQGVSPELSALADETVSIPMRPPVESLNASIAAAILMFALCA